MTLRLTFHSLRIVFVPFLFVCRVKVCHFGMLSIDPIRGISRKDEETICGSPVKNTEKGLSNISLAKTVKNAKHPRNRNYCFASLLFPHWIFLSFFLSALLHSELDARLLVLLLLFVPGAQPSQQLKKRCVVSTPSNAFSIGTMEKDEKKNGIYQLYPSQCALHRLHVCKHKTNNN